MDPWLVRTSQNRIEGPFDKTRVCEMIQSGKIGPQDEVCSGQGYWFYLHEHQEVKKHLGIEPPAVQATDEEITETHDIENQEPTESIDSPAGLKSPFPDLPHLAQGPKRSGIFEKLDRSTVWNILAWTMVVVTGLVLFGILRLLNIKSEPKPSTSSAEQIGYPSVHPEASQSPAAN